MYDVDPPQGTHTIHNPELDKLELGKLIYERWIGNSLDYPAGTPLQEMSTRWLLALGFERVEWLQKEDILICLLWRTVDGKVQEFGFEYAGDVIISVLEVTASVEL